MEMRFLISIEMKGLRRGVPIIFFESKPSRQVPKREIHLQNIFYL